MITSNAKQLLGELDLVIANTGNEMHGSIANDVPYTYFWEVGYNIYENGEVQQYVPPKMMLGFHAERTLASGYKKVMRAFVNARGFIVDADMMMAMNVIMKKALQSAAAATPTGTGVAKFGGSTKRVYHKRKRDYTGKPAPAPHVVDLGYPNNPMNRFRGWYLTKAQRGAYNV